MDHSFTQNKQNKTLTQQIFHPSLFNRPRSQSFSDCNENSKNENTSAAPVEAFGNNSPESSKWIEVQNRKRLRNSPEVISSQKQSKLSSYWLSQPLPTSNVFSELEDLEDKEKENSQPQPVEKLPKPPPLFIDKVTNIRPLIKLLNETVQDLFEIKVLPKDQVKIQPKSCDAYRTIVKELDAKRTEYYTYKPKQERAFKTILKNIHPSTDIEEIKEALIKLGHIAVNIWNIKQTLTKTPLHMFVVELQTNSNNKEIYNVKSLLHCRVKFEPPKPKRTIPQCANCQAYGHTKSYCRRNPRCIKCAGNHSSSACQRKERSDDVRCALCDGNHPANYKGCTVYKELQKQKYPPLRHKLIKPHKTVPETVYITPNQTPYHSYSDVARNSTRENTTKHNPPTTQQINETKRTLPPQKSNQESILMSQNVKPESTNNEMKEMMDMFKQMMQQMSTMTNLLLSLVTELRSQPTQHKCGQDFVQEGGRRST